MSFDLEESLSRQRRTAYRWLPPEARRLLAVGAAVFCATLVVGLAAGWVADRLGWNHEPHGERGKPFESKHSRGAASREGRSRKADTASFGEAPAPTPSALASMRLPIDRADLLDAPITNAFVATNADIPETALYGSARTGTDGRSRFHKGIDIAPALPLSRSGEATDPVRAVAPGCVLYVNRIAGNSSYGIYAVLLHDDPACEVYTLYAHLASIAPGVRPGAMLAAGDEIGVMGRSATTPIPKWRAHLHFEVGLMFSSRFGEWERATAQTPLRGNGHGWNLLAANPFDVLRAAAKHPGAFSMLEWLRAQPAACEIALHLDAAPDYFRRHAALWQGDAIPPGGADVALALTDSGLILRGRLATARESAALATVSTRGGAPRVAVLAADEALLGRNGMRLVVRERGAWRFGTGPAATRWLELLRL